MRGSPPSSTLLPSGALFRSAGHQPLAVAGQAHGVDEVGVPTEGADFLAGGRLPQAPGLVPAAGGQPPAVARQADGTDHVAVALEGADLLASLRLPQAGGLVM